MGPANRPLARSPGYVRAVLHPKGTMGGKVCPRNRKLVDRSRFFRPLWIRTYPEVTHRRAGPASAALAALPPRLPPSGKRLSANGDTYYALSHCQSEHHGLCGLPVQEQASPCSSDSLGADWD